MKTNALIEPQTPKISMFLNPTGRRHSYSRVRKVYIVHTNPTTTSFKEVDVTKITDGKTKYIPEELKLVQAIRLEFKQPPYKLDIFENNAKSEHHTYLDDKKQIWSSSFYCFVDKDQALEKLAQEYENKRQKRHYRKLEVA